MAARWRFAPKVAHLVIKVAPLFRQVQFFANTLECLQATFTGIEIIPWFRISGVLTALAGDRVQETTLHQ